MTEQPPDVPDADEAERRGLLSQLWDLPLSDLRLIVDAWYRQKIPGQKKDPPWR